MRLLIFSNIYIALAAVALTYETYALLGGAPRSHGLAALVFCATLFVYNLDRLVSLSREDAVEITERHRWIRARKKLLWPLVGVAAVGGAASLFFVPLDVLWGLVPLGVISLAYSLPVMIGAGRTWRLKDIPGLKIFLIALVWGSVTVVLPALNAGVDVFGRDAILALIERVIFIFAITLPFDVRDLERDRQAGLHTLPMTLGPSNTRWLAVGLMGVFCAVSAFHYGLSWAGPTVPMLSNGVLTAVLLWFSNESHQELYYVGLLDGTMLLQGLMVVGFVRVLMA